MLEEYSDLLTVDEVCEILRIGYNMIYTLLKEGKLKAFRCGRIWKIPKAAVELYIVKSAKI